MDACEPPSTSCREQDRHELLCVDVTQNAPAWSAHVDANCLVEAARAAYASSGKAREAAEVSLLLSDDDEVRTLNATWRGKDETTNVLSFPLDHPSQEDRARHLGDIVLACGTVVREADEKGIPVSQHAAHLVVHGLLHLLGFDHEDRNEAEKMEMLEVRILAEMGLPDPYAAPALESGDLT